MLSLKVCLIGESPNYDPFHHHGGSNVANDQESSVPVNGVVAVAGVTATIHKKFRGMRPSTNVINLDSGTIVVQIIVPCPVICPYSLPSKKPKRSTLM